MNIMRKLRPLLLACLLFPALGQAQAPVLQAAESLTLEQCIEYALTHDPTVRQALIDEQIGEREIKAALSGWLPQISAAYNASHNFELQRAAFGEQVITIGRENNSNILLQANQALFNSDLLLASKAARFNRLQLDLSTELSRINTVVDVSKAYYDILLTREQVNILNENIARIQRQYNDARSQYEAGLVDKTDYQRASITLANAMADRKRALESINAKYALLKQLMGYPADAPIGINTDNALLLEEALLQDTAQFVVYSDRVEYQLLLTQQELLDLNTKYYKWQFLPQVSSYFNYNLLYMNNEISNLYNTSFPTSAAGLQVALPIFQGTRRYQNLKIAQLQEQRLEVELDNMRNIINTQAELALANYKSDFNEWMTLKQNAEIAQEVYDIIKLQYDEGIKSYLDLIVAETDLRTAQLNYYNALYSVLESKLDYQKALGNIDIN